MIRSACVILFFVAVAARADDTSVKVTVVKPELRKIKRLVEQPAG